MNLTVWSFLPTLRFITDLQIIIDAECELAVRYLPDQPTSWLKIRNRSYSQWVGREELFERERGGDPDFRGWDECVRACETVRLSRPISKTSMLTEAPPRNAVSAVLLLSVSRYLHAGSG
jgi:hypothetical protein